MGDAGFSRTIKISSLKEYQKLFQKDVSELINLYVLDAKRKINALKKAFSEKHWENFLGALQELRHRSVDIGAHQFSYYCLQLEIAAIEMQLLEIPHRIALLERAFNEVEEELERIKESPLCKKPVPA